VTYEIAGELERFFLCHCSRCRKDTGSAHAANVFSTTAQLHWLSGEDAVTRYQLPSTRHSKSFCSRCGSALPGMQLEGKLLVIPAGSLDSRLPITADAHIYVADRADWDEGLEKLLHIQTLPG
jgi:hypothetical protein